MENLVTRKMTVNSANADQISFIIDLMHGYNESKLLDTEAMQNEFFYNTVLTKAKKSFLDTKKNSRREIKSFFSPIFTEYLPKDLQGVLLNAMNLNNGRNKITKFFEIKVTSLSIYDFDAKSHGVEESVWKFDESRGERVKLRRQKADDKTDETGDEQPETKDMPNLESEESAEQRRK